jgi:glycosyltransferase involved in cell wall biosynthesis
MSLRILHCISSVNPAAGGPIEGLKQMAAINSQHGHHIEVVSLDPPDAPWVQACPVKCHATGPGHIGNYRYSPRLVPWLRENAHHYDAVIVNGIWQYHVYAAWKALHGGPVPYFVFTHGMLDPWFKRTYPLKHLKKWLVWPWSEYRLLRDAAAVLFTCEEEKHLARQSFWLYRANEMVVNYGTSMPPADHGQQVSAFLSKFPQLSNTRNLLFLGRVHEKKGADLLFKAFAQARQAKGSAMDQVRLVMAGPADHEYGRQMQALAHKLGLDDVTVWTGMLQGDLKWGAFRTASAFILPSHQENFGIAVAEALACKVPVLISDQVNIWREIQHDGAGLVDTDTVEGTRRLIERWTDTPTNEWLKMGQKASASFQNRFLMDRAAESLVKTMEQFALKTRKRP